MTLLHQSQCFMGVGGHLRVVLVQFACLNPLIEGEFWQNLVIHFFKFFIRNFTVKVGMK